MKWRCRCQKRGRWRVLMKGLTYFAAMAILAAALMFAQSSTPSSDPSNSSNSSAQSQNGQNGSTNAGTSKQTSRHASGARTQVPSSQNAFPDTTIRDQQSGTTSTTGLSGQTNQPSASTMGTTGSTPGTGDQTPQRDTGANTPPTGTSTDQPPNSSTSPNSAPPQAYLNQTPAVRAVATHTPDPGTCMNPAALQTAQDGSQPRPASRCD